MKWFSYSRGYGYITTESAGDVFVHRTAAAEPLRKGQQVTLEVELTKRGLRAKNVRRTKSVIETRLAKLPAPAQNHLPNGTTYEA